jgi:hypothetical protein
VTFRLSSTQVPSGQYPAATNATTLCERQEAAAVQLLAVKLGN